MLLLPDILPPTTPADVVGVAAVDNIMLLLPGVGGGDDDIIVMPVFIATDD